MEVRTVYSLASKGTQQVKAFASIPDNLISNPGTHTLGEKKNNSQDCLLTSTTSRAFTNRLVCASSYLVDEQVSQTMDDKVPGAAWT